MSEHGSNHNKTFDHALNPRREWCEDLLEELAEIHHVAYTCDEHGDFRRRVNDNRRAFLEDVLGLSDVSYRVCEHCHTFALERNTTDWPYASACDNCENELLDKVHHE